MESQLVASEVAAAAELDVVREVAAPMVERAALTLELPSLSADKVDRLVSIVEGSRLPSSRVADIVDKLRDDQAARAAVDAAVERFAGGDVAAMRSGLDAVHHALVVGSFEGSTWFAGDRAIALGDRSMQGTVASRAEGLVADLGHAVASDGLGGEAGSAIRSFCLAVQHLLWEEDEEQEGEVWGSPTPELL